MATVHLFDRIHVEDVYPKTMAKNVPRYQKLWFIKPGPEVIKLFSCSNQLSMKF